MTDEGVARPRPVRRNPADGRKGKPGRARRAASREAFRTPESIAFCLGNPRLTAHRFPPYQWAVLQIAWGEWSGYRTSEYVAIRMGEDAASVREARKAAERLAYELAYSWYPALLRWQNGEELSKWDRKMLDKHRSNRTKKGRRGVPAALRPGPTSDPRRTIPFSEMGDPTREYAADLADDESATDANEP